jgi:hypothetical protein
VGDCSTALWHDSQTLPTDTESILKGLNHYHRRRARARCWLCVPLGAESGSICCSIPLFSFLFFSFPFYFLRAALFGSSFACRVGPATGQAMEIKTRQDGVRHTACERRRMRDDVRNSPAREYLGCVCSGGQARPKICPICRDFRFSSGRNARR